MKTHLFAPLFLLAILAPAFADAQNVTVPQGGSDSFMQKVHNFFVPDTSSMVAAPAPAPDAAAVAETTPTKPAPSLPLSSLPTAPAMSSAMTSGFAGLGATGAYISPAQQNGMIAREKQNLSFLQQRLVQMKQTESSVSSQIAYQNSSQPPSQAASQQRQAGLTQIQNMHAQQAVTINCQIQQSQKRLSVLQSGPLSVNDLMQMYQGGGSAC